MRRLGKVWPFAVATAVLLAIAVGQIPTTTEVLVDGQDASYQLPLYQKVLAFINRDLEMRSLAERVTAGVSSAPADRALRILSWTHDQVRPVPAGLPVVDDHPYNIVVRGYGTYDQAAEVFALLCAYADIPADWVIARDLRTNAQRYAFALAKIDGAFRVFDVREGRAFRNAAGDLATMTELQRDPSLTAELPIPSEAAGLPYATLFGYVDYSERNRVRDQMPLERLKGELGKLVRQLLKR